MKQSPLVVLLAILAPIILHFTLVIKLGFPGEIDNETQIDHLKAIAAEMHPFNSKGNLKVQKYLQKVIGELSERYESITLHEDLVSLTTSTHPILYYESSNVIASIKGNSSNAILVSAHYDSMFESYGVTDDGIAVSAMLSCLETLASENLTHTIIFLFNNNEESGLLGATAFRSHPLWPSVKAFINLEGTGVAESGRSFLFRANSFKLVERLMQAQTYPHSSIFAATIMKFVKSDTDYRVYLQGGKPGVDMAFYSKRYLYHTELDDLNHASFRSMAYMLENLKSSLLSLSSDNLVNELESESHQYDTMEYSKQTLPVPDYLFYDRFGKYGRAVTNYTYKIQLLALLLFVVIICILSIIIVVRKAGFRVGFQTLVYPSMRAFGYVTTTFLASLSLIFATSYIKTVVNPGSTYGFAELSLVSTYCLAMFVIAVFSELSPVFTTLDRISKKSDEEVSISLEQKQIIESKSDFLQVGLFLFWAFTALLAFIAASNGFALFFFFLDLATYSSLGLFFALVYPFLFHKNRSSFRITMSTIFANLIPSLYLWDTLDIGLWSLPSFIGEGIPDFAIDCVLGFYAILHLLTLMPILPSSRLVKWTLGSFLTTWILLMSWNPFGKERPVHYGYEEVFNLGDNFTTVNMMIMKTIPAKDILKRWRNEGLEIPEVQIYGHSFSWNDVLVPEIGEEDMLIKASLKSGVLEGFAKGSSDSRVCEISLDAQPNSYEINGDWSLQGTRCEMEIGNTLMVLRREISDSGMKIPFKFVFDANRTEVEITVTCHHHVYSKSPKFQKLHSQMPIWAIRQLKERATRSYGDLKVVKKSKMKESKWLDFF